MLRMHKKVSIFVLILTLFTISILTGCDSGSSLSDADVVYKYSGAKSVGDFIDVSLNLSDTTYSYAIREGKDAGEEGSGTFRLIGTSGIGPYQIDGSNDRFVMLDDEILLLSDNEAAAGNKLITALKRSNVNYADEIETGNLSGKYHIATSLEGYVGTVTIPDAGDQSKVEIDFGINGLLSLPFSYEADFHAMKLVEETLNEGSFRHFGVFTSDYKIGVIDSYEYVSGDWVGDGMSILIKEGTYNLAEYEGRYSYLDVDGSDSYMTFELKENEGSLELWVGDEALAINLTDPDQNGRIDFSADLVDDVSGTEDWHLLLLPEQMMILVSDTLGTFGGGDGGLGIGVKIN